jgi:hypothetical protein
MLLKKFSREILVIHVDKARHNKRKKVHQRLNSCCPKMTRMRPKSRRRNVLRGD